MEQGVVPGSWWHTLPDGRVQCDLCPRGCRLRDGQRGFCTIRQARNSAIYMTTYGRISGLHPDPIEKKPLNHFLPGSRVLSFGTAGCSLGCRFCQNWEMSRARTHRYASVPASPETLADTACHSGCRSVAFTYNEPTIFAEFAIDCAIAAHARGLKTVAVTAGYINPEARAAFFEHMDAANVDLKSFNPDFYRSLCLAERDPVLDTLLWLRNETDVWLEVTTLLIPGYNDSSAEVQALCEWFSHNLGEEVPLHFTAFHPAYKFRDVPPTTLDTLRSARKQAQEAGLRYVYTGNIADVRGQCSYCPSCGIPLIERAGYRIRRWNLNADAECAGCGYPIAGIFETHTPASMPRPA